MTTIPMNAAGSIAATSGSSRNAKNGWLKRAYRALIIARAESVFHRMDDRTLAYTGYRREDIPALARRVADGF
jgi:hypothetical protein